MFYDTSCYPFTKKLEDNWEEILVEYQNLKSGAIPYPETHLYEGEWDVFPFLFFGEIFFDNCSNCPKTWGVLGDLPGLKTASFSILRANTKISPHTGFTKEVLRCHLSLKIPDSCAIMVGDEEWTWQEGKCFVFDDTVWHSAYNASNQDRVVLLLDFEKTNKESWN